jgi:hypothetical protein
MKNEKSGKKVIGGVQPKHHAPKTRMQSYVRRQKLIKGLIEGKAISEIAPTLNLSPKTARTQAHLMLREPNTQMSFIRILEESGLTDKFLADKIKSLVNAETKQYFQADGKVTDERTQPAWETQRKTVELATKLKGHLKEKSESDINIGLMQVVVQAIAKP